MNYAAITDRLAGLGAEVWAVHFRGRELQRAGRDIIELTIGEPDVAPDPALIAACTAALQSGRVRYSDGQGEPALRKAIAARYAERARRAVSADQVLCVPGTQTALFAASAALVQDGDEVLLPDPYYAMSWFTTDQIGIWNWERFDSPEFDRLQQEAVVEADPEKRAAMYVKMQDLMEESGAYKFLTHEASPVMYREPMQPALRPDARPLYLGFKP